MKSNILFSFPSLLCFFLYLQFSTPLHVPPPRVRLVRAVVPLVDMLYFRSEPFPCLEHVFPLAGRGFFFFWPPPAHAL